MWKRIIVIAAVAGLIVGGTASSAIGGRGHDPVTFCHNGHTITTDDTGLIEGHMRHVESGKDSLGSCPTPEDGATSSPSPSPTSNPVPSTPPQSTPTPSPSATSEPPKVECEEGYVPGWLDENGNPQGCVNNGPTEEHLIPPVVVEAPAPTPVVATPTFTG